MPEIWDVEDPKNAGKEPLCLSINRKSEPYFKKVYHNEKFDVFKILMWWLDSAVVRDELQTDEPFMFKELFIYYFISLLFLF